jgi:hypothetical protein
MSHVRPDIDYMSAICSIRAHCHMLSRWQRSDIQRENRFTNLKNTNVTPRRRRTSVGQLLVADMVLRDSKTGASSLHIILKLMVDVLYRSTR